MKKENFWYVYVHTNKINGKKYIGITGQQRYWERWRSDGSGYKTQVFGRAIEKYGWDNFSHDILDKVTSESKACELEQFYIQKYKTNQPEFGYNISLGGESTMTGVYNLPSISIPVYQYSLNGDYIAEFPSMMEAERQTGIDNSAICACCKGIHKYTKEFIWSYEKRDKIEGVNPKEYRYEKIIKKQEKKVYKYNLQGEFIESYKSLSEASRVTGIDFKRISACCLGKRKRTDDYMWSYVFANKIEPFEKNIKPYSKKKKTVYQYDACGNLIAVYANVDDVVIEFNVSNSYLRKICRKNSDGIFSLYNGYIWSYCELNYTFFQIEINHKKSSMVCKMKKERISKYDNVNIYQYSKDGYFIKAYTDIKDVIKTLNLEPKAKYSIIACCKGKSKTSYEYQWRFYFCDRINEISKLQIEKPILKLNRNGVLIQEYENVMQIGSEYVKTVRQRAITNIINCACGRLKTFDGYIWIFKDDYTNLNIEYRQKSYKTIPVAQYDKDNNYIQTFNSIADAQNYLNIKNSHISDCCSGKRQTDHGYIWKYVNIH